MLLPCAVTALQFHYIDSYGDLEPAKIAAYVWRWEEADRL